MIRRRAIWLGYLLFLAALGASAPAAGQPVLTLADAVARARAKNPDAGSAAAAERAAEQRVTQARAGYLPRVDVSESWQRSNQPVFVFSSLLSQRQFTAANFALPALNHPDPLDNFRSAVTVEQSLFDGGTRAGVSAAAIGRDMATAQRIVIDRELAVSVTTVYGRVLIAESARRSAAAAVERARADREIAGNRRDAGVVTDSDVLQLDVFLSRAQEQEIRAVSDERIARAQLNQLMGDPLDAPFVLERTAPPPTADYTDLAALQTEAVRNRPDVKLAVLQEQLAGATRSAARAAFLPQASVQGGWEFNGGTWNGRASSWMVGAVARLNLFNGFADRARLAEAQEHVTRTARERDKVETAARLEVYSVVARLESARASEAVGRAAVEQSRESQRIIRDRYESGLADVAALLRAAEAVVQAEAQQTAAQVAVLTETAALERTLGRR
jgi:outer membrane protein TolC